MTKDFFVLSVQRPEGERFAIVRPDDWFRESTLSQWASRETWQESVERFIGSLELLTEDSVRQRLEAMGIEGHNAFEQIVRARRAAHLSKDASWEHVTAIGYRNQEGQQVVAKTGRKGSTPDQLVFVLRCTVCGFEYGTEGADIARRCCPSCQDGEPGLPA